jgi:hypothetical protein
VVGGSSSTGLVIGEPWSTAPLSHLFGMKVSAAAKPL